MRGAENGELGGCAAVCIHACAHQLIDGSGSTSMVPVSLSVSAKSATLFFEPVLR